MIYLIIGRTGSGKDYLATLLQKRNMSIVKSYTTRPKRSETENSHIFITKEEADTTYNKVARTVINGYEYFATKTQVEQSDIYIIDPKGLNELVANMPDTAFHVIYVETESESTRKLHAISRADDKIKEELIFDQRNNDENEMFSDFEKKLSNVFNENFPANITGIELFENTYDNTNAEHFADYIMAHRLLHNAMMSIVKEGLEYGIISNSEAEPDKIRIVQKDKTENAISMDRFVEVLTSNPHGMTDFMKAYILKSKRFDDIVSKL